MRTRSDISPTNSRALQVKVAAHQQLMERSQGENFSEVMWLKSEQEAARALLGNSNA